MLVGNSYLGFKNRKSTVYLLASAFQEEREPLGARKMVTTVSEVRTPYCYGSGTKVPKPKWLSWPRRIGPSTGVANVSCRPMPAREACSRSPMR